MRVNIIFRQGLIGDTIVAIPALHYLREKFPHSKNIYISMVRSEKHCKPSQILDGSRLIYKFILVRKYSHYLYKTLIQRTELKHKCLLEQHKPDHQIIEHLL